jgi:hypothetical protein
MLAYYLAWYLPQALKPPLFDDEHPPPQPDPVAKARRSEQAEQKARTKRTATGAPCHSLATLLDELSTRARTTIRLHQSSASFQQLTKPTPTQVDRSSPESGAVFPLVAGLWVDRGWIGRDYVSGL